jgi:hypothetical protein
MLIAVKIMTDIEKRLINCEEVVYLTRFILIYKLETDTMIKAAIAVVISIVVK